MAIAKTKSAKAAAEPVKKKASRRKASAKMSTATKPKARRTAKKTGKAGPIGDPAGMRCEIEMLAYRLWEERGCPQGSGLEDWTQAEQQLTSSSSV
jgi:hypothetical protein